MGSDERARLGQRGNAANGTIVLSGFVCTPGTDNLIIVSRSHGTGMTRIWESGGPAYEAAQSFSTATSAATAKLAIGPGAGYDGPPAGTRIYHFSCGEGFLDDAAATAIRAHLAARHGRSYG